MSTKPAIFHGEVRETISVRERGEQDRKTKWFGLKASTALL